MSDAMSFKFSHNNTPFWAKQLAKQTEIYRLEKKELARKMLMLDGKPNQEEIARPLENLPRQA